MPALRRKSRSRSTHEGEGHQHRGRGRLGFATASVTAYAYPVLFLEVGDELFFLSGNRSATGDTLRTMTAHSADLKRACTQCGSAGTEHWRARASENGLRVSNGFHCEVCEHAYEADGAELSAELRDAFIRVEGEWLIVVMNVGARPHAATRIVSDMMGCSLVEALRAVRERQPITKKTLVEIEQLRIELEKAGADVVISRAR